MIGYLVPKLQYLGIVWVFVMLADLPISALAYALAWNHSTLAGIWVVVAGTWWWYAIGITVAKLFRKVSAR